MSVFWIITLAQRVLHHGDQQSIMEYTKFDQPNAFDRQAPQKRIYTMLWPPETKLPELCVTSVRVKCPEVKDAFNDRRYFV